MGGGGALIKNIGRSMLVALGVMGVAAIGTSAVYFLVSGILSGNLLYVVGSIWLFTTVLVYPGRPT